MSRTLVVHVPYAAVHDVLDPERLRRVGRDAAEEVDVEVLTTPWGITSAERLARARDPYSAELRELEAPLTAEQAEAFGRAEVLFTLDVPLDLSRRAPNVRWVQTVASGVAQFVAARLDEAGVVLTNGAGIGSTPIAEWVLARVLQMVKSLPVHDEQARRAEWRRAPGGVLEGSTMAVVGLGAIGRAVARRARALGVHVIGVRRSVDHGATDPDVDELVPADRLHEVLHRSDVAVLCAAGSQANRDLFDAAAFAAMPQGARFVNVSRGDLVVEEALVAALESGHLAGAAIDVARTEPLPPQDPLWQAPNLLISPHSSATGEAFAPRALGLFVENLGRYLSGEPLLNVVDLVAQYGAPPPGDRPPVVPGPDPTRAGVPEGDR